MFQSTRHIYLLSHPFQAPCEERHRSGFAVSSSRAFQSTRPMRGATPDDQRVDVYKMFQSTRPMRGATSDVVMEKALPYVSIHAPRVGRDTCRMLGFASSTGFNPRAPCGARPHARCLSVGKAGVSIHAPHAGRDRGIPRSSVQSWRFNPRAPCGARRVIVCHVLSFLKFQSTRPMRGATSIRQHIHKSVCVSIHAPHAGRDLGGKLQWDGKSVSIHAPHAGRDHQKPPSWEAQISFNPRAPCGARRQ